MSRYQSEYNYFNTKLTIVFESDNFTLVRDLNEEIVYKANQLHFLFNYYDKNSDIHYLNTHKEIMIDADNEDLLEIIKEAMEYRKLTHNYFNIDNTFPIIDTISIKGQTIAIKNEIDLGGLAKGYFLDFCNKLLDKYDEKVFINFGGSVLSHWDNLRIGLKDVHNIEGNVLTVLLNKNETLHTSATYEQKLPDDTTHVYHLKNEYIANHLKSVTVIDTLSSRCDALAIAVFAMETSIGVSFCKENNIKAIIIDDDKIYINEKLMHSILINDFSSEIITF